MTLDILIQNSSLTPEEQYGFLELVSHLTPEAKVEFEELCVSDSSLIETLWQNYSMKLTALTDNDNILLNALLGREEEFLKQRESEGK